MLNSDNCLASNSRLSNVRRPILTGFRRDEDGGIIILTLLLLMTILVMGGMAVDFMRFESQRVQLQSVSDRATLAAAELDVDKSKAELVITDFFETAGFADNIIGTPVIVDNGNSRTVSVDSQVDINTFYLRLVGIDQLSAPARSGATEGVGKVEISLVLDISGSMRYASSTTSESNGGKFADLQDAAKAFANKVLDPENGGQVSLNIIPYAGGTNPGPHMFDYLNGVRLASPSIIGDGDGDGDGSIVATVDPFQLSSCLELTAADFTGSGLPGLGRQQVPHFQYWSIAASVMDWGWCPQDVSSIRYAISDATEAADFIDGIRMHDGTGTHYGMKYGLAALDPTSQPAFAAMNAIDDGLVPDAFVNRPAGWDDNETRKIIVLMTDGAITEQVRPNNGLDPLNLTNHLQGRSSSFRYELSSRTTNVNRFDDVCDLAKSSERDVAVYTVAFAVGAGSAAETQMKNCASQASMFFRASGTDITTVFEDIAQQITDLRLNL